MPVQLRSMPEVRGTTGGRSGGIDDKGICDGGSTESQVKKITYLLNDSRPEVR